MTSLMNQAVISVFIAIVLFSTIEITWSIYAVPFVVIWLLLSINFSVFKNHGLYEKMFFISLLVSIVLYISLSIKKEPIIRHSYDELAIFVVGIILLAAMMALVVSRLNKTKNKAVKPIVIPKREKDLQSLMKYLDTFEIVGVNGRWGTGKTFLVNRLKEKKVDDYEFIEIDLLTSNLNEMQFALIKGFEEILTKNEILPKYAQKLKKMIDSSSLTSKIRDVTHLIFEESESKSEIIQAFQNEVRKLDKKVLVIYEDMDRISNKQVIQEIFSISEKIANDRIKIIYQYDESIMIRDIGFSYDYLEKYIPFKMNLTELDFKESLQFELQMNPESLLEIDDFKFLDEQKKSFNLLTAHFGMKDEFTIELKNIPFRKVKQLVIEIELAFATKRDLYENNKNTVISFFILKHLYPHIYEKLSSQISLSEALTFRIDSEQYTIHQLFEKNKGKQFQKSKVEEAFKKSENQENYQTFKLFGYEIYDGNSTNARTYIEHRNMKVDRIIWNLLYEGESSLTDVEYMVEQFIEQVIEKTGEEQKSAYFHFLKRLEDLINKEKKMYRQLDLRDVFEGFRLVNEDAKQQEKLLDLYFKYSNKSSEFNPEVVQYMNLNPIHTRSEYLKIIRYINELDIVGNLNGDYAFGEFLNKYIQAAERFHYGSSYADYAAENQLAGHYDKFREKLIDFIEKFLEKLKEFKVKREKKDLEEIVKEYEDIIFFLEKMIRVIQTENPAVTTKEAEIMSEIEVRGNKKLKELKELYRSDPKEGKKQMMKAYEKEEITLSHIDAILKGE